MVNLVFKPAFLEKYKALTDFSAYQKAVEQFPRKSIRINILRTTIEETKRSLEQQGWKLKKIEWCKEGFYVEHETQRRDIGHVPEHEEGKIFIQRSVSMIPTEVLNPQPGEIILDMAAAPGAKTTHLAAKMQNKGIIIANEPDRYRMNGLIVNLQRCCVMNTVVTNSSGEKMTGAYDRILLDAPCSGSGLIKGKKQKVADTLKVWNQNTIMRLQKLQKKLILHAYNLLKPNGTLVYSTCSLEPEEDEQIIDFLCEKTDAQREKSGLNIRSSEKQALKIWPQYYYTEGFFVAKIRKGT